MDGEQKIPLQCTLISHEHKKASSLPGYSICRHCDQKQRPTANDLCCILAILILHSGHPLS